MSSKTKANRIFEKWRVDYVEMDKKRESIRDNFDQLFFALYNANIPWEESRDIADDAIKHHLPSTSTAKFIYAAKKRFTKLSFKEWKESWEEDIRNKGLASFYDLFPLEDEPEKPAPTKRATGKANSLKGMKTDDDLNAEDFYKSSKLVTRDNPRLFGNEDDNER